MLLPVLRSVESETQFCFARQALPWDTSSEPFMTFFIFSYLLTFTENFFTLCLNSQLISASVSDCLMFLVLPIHTALTLLLLKSIANMWPHKTTGASESVCNIEWGHRTSWQKPSRGCYHLRIEGRLTLEIGAQKGKKEVKAVVKIEVNIGVKVGKERFTRIKSF